MAGRSATTVMNRNGFSLSLPSSVFLSWPLTTKPLRSSTRISLVGNCDRFLHTHRIPQAVPRILGIPDGSPGGRKNETGKGAKREAETTKTKADKKFLHDYSAHSESLRECEQCYIEYLFSFQPDASNDWKGQNYFFFFRDYIYIYMWRFRRIGR